MGDVLQADIYEVLSDTNIQWDSLRAATVLVTGATGLVGSALATALSAANARFALDLRLTINSRMVCHCDKL